MQIQNPDVGQVLRDEAKLTLVESSSQNLLPNVQAVIDVTPSKSVTRYLGSTLRSTTGTSSLLASDTLSEYVIHGIYISATADSSCDVSEFWIGGTIDGVASRRLCAFRKTTLTAFNGSLYVPFPVPLVLRQGTAIDLNLSFTVGTASFMAVVYGFKRPIS